MKKKWINIVDYFLVIGIVACLNVLFAQYFFRIDLTEDNRYSLAPVTKDILRNLDEKVYVEVFLAGDMNPGYERLKKTIKEKLQEFKVYSNKGLEFRFVDPNQIADKKIRENFYTQLVKKGLHYRYYLEEKGGQKDEKIIFPGALIYYHEREIPVMFMKGKKMISPEEELNEAVEDVEFGLISGLRRVTAKKVKNIAFVEGHGAFDEDEVADISSSLFENYNVQRIHLSDSTALKPFSVLIIAGPKTAYSEPEKLKLDQYIMKGGSVLFLINALNVYKDSLANGVTYGLPYKLNLEDLLFTYGLRLNPTLIQDKYSGVIKVQTAADGQEQMLSYPFYPVIYNFSKNPIVKNLDAILTHFIGTIDTVKAENVKKTPLLFTSTDTRIYSSPVQINLNDLRKNVALNKFNAGSLTVGYLLEGNFTSLYKNRPLPIPVKDYLSVSKPAKILLVSDADIIKNDYDAQLKKPVPLGFDVNMRYQFSNKDFLLNAIDYLAGEEIVNVRGKEIKMRPLDKEAVTEGRMEWRVINIIAPLVLLILFGILRYYYRKKKYSNF